MRTMVLAGLFALTASTSFAQTDNAPGPANLCRELVAFMKVPPPEAESSPAAAARADKGGSTQEASGQGGPAHAAPEQNATSAEDSSAGATSAGDAAGNDASEAGTTAQNAQQTSGLSAPIPSNPASTPKASVMTVDEAEQLAGTGDIAACRDAARKLRIAGVAMPPPLLALTALDLRHHRAPR